MKWIKAIGCSLMAIALVIFLAACGKGVQDGTQSLAGKWQREVVYLPHYEMKVDLVLTLKEDGTYEKVVTGHENGTLLTTEEGTWTFEMGELVCTRNQETAIMRYEYDPDTNTLENGGYQYEKIS